MNAEVPAEPGEQTRAFVRFQVGQVQVALLAEAVEEAMEPLTITPVPCAPRHVPGIVAVHGEALPLFDVARFLGLDAAAPESPRLLVVRSSEYRVGILCEHVQGVATVATSKIREARVTSPPSLRRYAFGEIELPDGVLPLLDLDRLLEDGRAR